MRTDRNGLAYRSVKSLGRVIDFIIIAMVVLIALIGIYALWDSKQVFAEASSARYEVYRPVENDTKSFEELQALNTDVFAWICEYGTKIDYPVVQGEDNFCYINKSVEGTYSLSGAIFLDFRNQKDFTDPVSIIYGHHMDQDAMFGDVDQFVKDGYLQEHPYGSLYVNGKTMGLENIAYMETDAYDHMIYDLTKSTADVLRYVDQKASQKRPVEVGADDRIVILSTCAVSYTDARQLLIAKLTDTAQENPFPAEEENRKTTHMEVPMLKGEWHQAPVFLWWLILVLAVIIIVGMIIKAYRRRKMRKAEKD